MNTAPGDNNRPENTTGAPGETPGPEGATEAAAVPGAGTEPGPAEGRPSSERVEAEPRSSGAFSAETLSIVSLILLGVVVISGQLVELLISMVLIGGQPVSPQQATQVSTQLIAGGIVALLTALVGVLALVMSGRGTRPWARWLAAAATILGILFLIIAVVAYLMIPEASQMMPPVMN